MKRCFLVALVVLGVFSLATPMVGQDDVYLHGGNAEALINSCAGVDRMDPRARTAPLKDAQNLSYCFGYIGGVIDMHNALNALLPNPKDYTYCVPDSASITQLAKVVVKYGNDHPEEIHQAALLVLSNAFIRGFPCK
jgi:hypothetical protein